MVFFTDAMPGGADEDMDISPGSTPTEESQLERQLIHSSPCAASQTFSTSAPVTLTSLSFSSPSTSSFLSTLTSLQNALGHVTPHPSTSAPPSSSCSQQLPQPHHSRSSTSPSDPLSLLASLPSLVSQLKGVDGSPLNANSSTSADFRHQPDQQQILQQGIVYLLLFFPPIQVLTE